MIKKIFKFILYIICLPFCSFKSLDFKRKLKSYVSFKSVKRKFKQIGNNCNVQYPFTIAGYKNISIGNNFNCGSNLRLETWDISIEKKPNFCIGDNVKIMDYCQFSCSNEIVIGNNVLIGANVFISDNSHGDLNNVDLEIAPSEREIYSKGSIIIGNNVWIGRNAVILSNVKIGNNAIIGANSVVTKDIPANEVWAGAPAKFIKKLID